MLWMERCGLRGICKIKDLLSLITRFGIKAGYLDETDPIVVS